mgnify:FL=1
MPSYHGYEVRIVGNQDPFGTKVEFLKFPGTFLEVDTHILMGTEFPMPQIGTKAPINPDHICKHCRFVGATKKARVAHERQIHDPDKVNGFQCHLCKYHSSSPQALMIHKARHHKINESGHTITPDPWYAPWWLNTVVPE